VAEAIDATPARLFWTEFTSENLESIEAELDRAAAVAVTSSPTFEMVAFKVAVGSMLVNWVLVIAPPHVEVLMVAELAIAADVRATSPATLSTVPFSSEDESPQKFW